MADDQHVAREQPLTNEELIEFRRMLSGRQPKRWWSDYSLLVAVFAFLLSLFTSLISAYASHRRDVHDQQEQLSSAIGKLQDLNLKSVEVHEKYKGTEYEGLASGLINNEIGSTLHTATKMALDLRLDATTADLAGIAQGTYGLGDYESTEKLLRYALQAATTANEESMALRELGFYTIRTGRGGVALQAGEEYFNRAYQLDKKYNLAEQPVVIAWLRSTAQIGWAGALATVDCPNAQAHFARGVELIASAPTSIDFDQARSAVKQQWAAGIGGVSECRPSASTPALT
jgi:hypothetical protein